MICLSCGSVLDTDTQGCTIHCGCGLPLIAALPLVFLVEWLWPSTIPFSLFQFWGLHGSFAAIALDAWPLFAVGVGLLLFRFFFTPVIDIEYLSRPDRLIPKRFLVTSGCQSLWTGIVEELVFRWIFFYSGIVILTVANFCLFGFAGFGLPKWLYLYIAMPIADIATLGKLHALLFNSHYSWAVGAAILSANGKFRRGHAYQGFIGWIWAWYGGMFLFLLMFKYGLFVAILTHVLYDLLMSCLLGLWLLYIRLRLPQFTKRYL